LHNFPVVVVDNFFKDPDKIRKFALSLEYKKDEISNYPGLRTDCLSKIAPQVYNEILKKFFSIYYDFNNEALTWMVSVQFQKTDNNFDTGWIHFDNDGNTANKVSGIVYLSPDAPLNSGTSIYKLKDNVVMPALNAKAKYTHYQNNGKLEDLVALKELERNQFDETIKVSNVYNRLISFEAGEYHSAQSYFGEDNESRLILVFFVSRFDANLRPLERANINRI
jgi:hypothetical protein